MSSLLVVQHGSDAGLGPFIYFLQVKRIRQGSPVNVQRLLSVAKKSHREHLLFRCGNVLDMSIGGHSRLNPSFFNLLWKELKPAQCWRKNQFCTGYWLCMSQLLFTSFHYIPGMEESNLPCPLFIHEIQDFLPKTQKEPSKKKT